MRVSFPHNVEYTDLRTGDLVVYLADSSPSRSTFARRVVACYLIVGLADSSDLPEGLQRFDVIDRGTPSTAIFDASDNKHLFRADRRRRYTPADLVSTY